MSTVERTVAFATAMDQKASSPQPPITEEATVPFDPSRRITKRKALIKDLATAYHAECLKCCQELLELQRECEKAHIEQKTPDQSRKEVCQIPRPAKRSKKTR